MYRVTVQFGFSVLALFVPEWVNAQEDFKGAVGSITDFMMTLVPLLTAIALLLFFWGLAEYVIATGSNDKEASKERMVWGLVGLFVITTIWGIVQLFGGSIAVL